MKTLTWSILPRCAVVAVLALATHAGVAQGPHEELVDLGGYKLFTSESGAGVPIVVFESGMGEGVSTWQKVQPDVSKFARTFTYDRAGLDKSDPSPHARTVEQMVSELHSLLRSAKVPSPYIFVGHSLGGAIVQLYAYKYPSEVAGLVLVDPEDGRLLTKLQSRMPIDQWKERERLLSKFMSNATSTQKAELEGTKTSGEALTGALPLPNVPVTLLTGTKKDPDFPGNPLEQDIKLELQNELLIQIPHSRHVLVPESRHYIQEDAPRVVMEAIHEMLAEGALKSKLAGALP